MKKLYFLFFLAFSLLANAQIINFPDANFKAKLLSASSSNSVAKNLSGVYFKIDSNNDGEIQVSEAQQVRDLDVNNSSISNLIGIEGFTNLEYLNCYNNQLINLDVTQNPNLVTFSCGNNQLIALDVSQNIALISLYCDNNQLTALDVTQNPNLVTFYCDNNQLTALVFTQNPNLVTLRCQSNQLTALDVSQNIALKSLYCINNQLTNLDVTQNPNLETLSCPNNQLTALDVSQNIALKALYCNSNQLTTIDVTQNSNLETFSCYSNQLTIIDVTQNPNLQYFSCQSNQLTIIDVTQNPNLESLNCSNTPSLEVLFIKNGNINPWTNLNFSNNLILKFVCCDEDDLLMVQQKINTYGYTNCHVNTYCSFTPNGTFYEITGNTKFDYDANGCDVGDIDYSNLKFDITNGTNTGSMIANTSGNYYIPVQAGNHTITPVLENPTYFNINPTSFVANFPTDASPFTQDFCVTASGVKSDVEVMVLSTVPARPGFDATYKISYRNKGNQIENGSVSLTFDDTKLDYVSSNPSFDSSAANLYTWNYTNLQPFETREIEVVFNVNGPTETPAVNNGDVLNYTVSITTSNTDETPNDNTFTLDQTVVGSYDPNDKTCLEGETVEPSMIGEYVHYVIRFENTGTFPAENIVVKDMIDLAKFDIATLIPLKGSHDYFTRIKDNKVEFIFENINLDFNDATNDGYVAFKIKTKSTLVVGNTFSNNANIYFDYNFPITTNTYTTTIAALSNQSFEFGSQFTLYPNPAEEVLNIQSKNSLAIQSVEIYNVLGQVVLAVPNNRNAIDVSNLKTGTYFVKVNTVKGSSNTKFVKE